MSATVGPAGRARISIRRWGSSPTRQRRRGSSATPCRGAAAARQARACRPPRAPRAAPPRPPPAGSGRAGRRSRRTARPGRRSSRGRSDARRGEPRSRRPARGRPPPGRTARPASPPTAGARSSSGELVAAARTGATAIWAALKAAAKADGRHAQVHVQAGRRALERHVVPAQAQRLVAVDADLEGPAAQAAQARPAARGTGASRSWRRAPGPRARRVGRMPIVIGRAPGRRRRARHAVEARRAGRRAAPRSGRPASATGSELNSRLKRSSSRSRRGSSVGGAHRVVDRRRAGVGVDQADLQLRRPVDGGPAPKPGRASSPLEGGHAVAAALAAKRRWSSSEKLSVVDLLAHGSSCPMRRAASPSPRWRAARRRGSRNHQCARRPIGPDRRATPRGRGPLRVARAGAWSCWPPCSARGSPSSTRTVVNIALPASARTSTPAWRACSGRSTPTR